MSEHQKAGAPHGHVGLLAGTIVTVPYAVFCRMPWMKDQEHLATKHSLLGRSLKYAGLAMAGVVFLTWAVSTQRVFGTSIDGYTVLIADGSCFLFHGFNDWTYDDTYTAFCGLRPGGFGLCMPSKAALWGLWSFVLPLWIPFLIVGVPTLFFFWRGRRAVLQGHCRSCGYNLTANTTGVCPECGTCIPEDTQTKWSDKESKPAPIPPKE